MNKKTLTPVDNSVQKSFLRCYTLCFALLSAAVFSFFYLNGRTFVWRSDGWIQQIRALIYTSQSLRSFLKELFLDQRLFFPQWDFAFGEGSNTLSPIHFYAFGDPFNLLSVFVPMRFMHDYYDVMVLVRIYCAGLAFGLFAREMGLKQIRSLLAGALTYCFSFYVLMFCGRHPFFINNLVWLPMILCGIERVLKGNSPRLFIFGVFCSAVSMIYFFWMMALFGITFFVVRVCGPYRNLGKDIFRKLLYVGFSALGGLAMAALIVAPMTAFLLRDQRLSMPSYVPLFYPFSHYAKFFGNLITQSADDDFWLNLGFGSAGFFALCLTIRKRKTRPQLFIFFTLCLLPLIFPFFGHVINCLSYISDRWCFAFTLLTAFSVSVYWEDMTAEDRSTQRFLSICLCVWSLLCLNFSHSRNIWVYFGLGIGFSFLLICGRVSDQKLKERLCLGLLSLGLFLNAACYFTGHGTVTQNKLHAYFFNGFFTNETEEILKAAQDSGVNDFYRYSGRDMNFNAGLLRHLSSTNYLWSLTNAKSIIFGNEMGINEASHQIMTGLNERAALLSLDAVRFYSAPYGGFIPYGFKTLENHPTIYENEYALPLGYSYTKTISAETWNKLNAIQKQNAMLQALYLPESPSTDASAELLLDDEELPFSVESDGNADYSDGVMTAKKAGAKLTFRFDPVPNSELYFSVSRLNFEPAEKHFDSEYFKTLPLREKSDYLGSYLMNEAPKGISLILTSGDHRSVLPFNTPENIYYSGRHDFSIDLGWFEAGTDSLTLELPAEGSYHFDTIRITAQPMTHYAEWIKDRRQSVMENISIETNRVRGHITLDTPAYLCLAIPNEPGWTALVNGKPAELLSANIKFMALSLPEGTHEIELCYRLPYLRAGALVSCSAWLFFLCVFVCLPWLRKRQTRDTETQAPRSF